MDRALVFAVSIENGNFLENAVQADFGPELPFRQFESSVSR
jgi:hypothetical protein